MIDSLKKLLDQGCEALDLSLNIHQQTQIFSYVDLLKKWNRHFNLTAITLPKEILIQHVLDSFSVLPYLKQVTSLCDVGTGAGIPGLILAICRPDCRHVLLDGNGKKIRFLVQTIHELGLKNVEAFHSRAEDYHTDRCFDGIISRAVGPISELISNTQHLLCTNGHWYAMKGQLPTAELSGCAQPYQIERLVVPMLSAERHLVTIEG